MEQDYRSPQEEKVGITHYLTPGTQIPAITKYLYSDFVVNEIDKFQQLVQLKVRPGEKVPEPTQPISYELTNELKEQMREKLGGQAAESIEKLYYSLECGQKAGPWQFTVGGELNRDQRIAIHDFVREKLTNIESTAVEGGKIRLKFNRNMRKMNPNARQKYTYFTLYKHGIDTFNALFRLSKIMNISNKIFSTAGLKDKRGHTTQLVSVYNTDLPTLQKFYKVADRNRELWIQDFQECKDSKLEVGGLFGNQFGLVLRLLDSSQGPELLSRVDSLREKGMVNYFGLQRFGQFSVKTYELGAMVLRKQWKQLIESILLSDCGNFTINCLKKELYDSKDYNKAERSLQNKYKIEKLIFKGLHKMGESYQNIFETLPRSIKSLYAHALQSYVWNRVVSKRIKDHGLALVHNDLVGLKVAQTQAVVEHEEEEELEEVKEEFVQEDEQFETVLINEQNIHQYTIHDLVAPLYGPSATVPHNSILYAYLQEELADLGLQDEDFLKNASLYCFKGQFRKMIVKPNKVEAKLVFHLNPKDELLSPFYTMGDEVKVQPGELSSLVVILQLPKSSYATMAIRELLHVSSEFDVQMQLNRQYEKRFLSRPQ